MINHSVDTLSIHEHPKTMIVGFWLFVFSVHFVHCLRSTGYRNEFENNSNEKTRTDLSTISLAVIRNDKKESHRLKTNLNKSNLQSMVNDFRNDQLLAQESNEIKERSGDYEMDSSDKYTSSMKKVKDICKFDFIYWI